LAGASDNQKYTALYPWCVAVSEIEGYFQVFVGLFRAEEGKNDSQAYFDKYIDSLQAFNDFALGYNE
jgi:hypothetical protein